MSLHLTWHHNSEKLESSSDLLDELSAELESEVSECDIRFFEDLRCMHVETIKCHREIIAVERENMRFIFRGSFFDHRFHTSERLDEGFIVYGEPHLSVSSLSERRSRVSNTLSFRRG